MAIGAAPRTDPGDYEPHQLGGGGQERRRSLSAAASGPDDAGRDRRARAPRAPRCDQPASAPDALSKSHELRAHDALASQPVRPMPSANRMSSARTTL